LRAGPERQVERGMVLGDRSLIPEEPENASQQSGVTLVLTISGQHVAVLHLALRAFAMPAAPRVFVKLVLIWLYILVAGAPPSAIRAGVVATLVLAAGCSGSRSRPYDGRNLQRPESPLLGYGGEEPKVEVWSQGGGRSLLCPHNGEAETLGLVGPP